MDYEFAQISAYDGTARKVTVIEVFNTTTAQLVSIVRRRAYETKADWIARAEAECDLQAAALKKAA